MSSIKLISFGKLIENLSISIENKIIGSEFATFEKRIINGDTILFVCDSKVWGMAKITSSVFYDRTVLWQNKIYPYRAIINNIVVFKNFFKFSDYGIDDIFRKNIGRQWAFKILFTPGVLPADAIEELARIVENLDRLEISSYREYFLNNQKILEQLKRKKLGLD